MNEAHIAGIEKALAEAGGTHTIADLLRQVVLQGAQIWTQGNACIVTEVQDTPQKRVLHFWVATGELDAVRTLSEKVIDWGRKQGCETATLIGRRGWERVLPEWQASVMTVMTREL